MKSNIKTRAITIYKNVIIWILHSYQRAMKGPFGIEEIISGSSLCSSKVKDMLLRI